MVPAQGNQQRSYDNKSNANRARVNHVNAEQAEEATDVVIGNLLVNSVFAKVLFNTGASHSFVSHSFAQAIDVQQDTLITLVLILTPRSQSRTTRISRGT